MYNRRHLIQMLQRENLLKEDKTAIRFALWCIDNNSPQTKGFPFWRCMGYTDDGCSRYQCLNCKNDWEGRTAPGFYNRYEKVYGSNPKLDNGYFTDDGGIFYYKKIDPPEYKAYYIYCPCCGIKFEGPICDDEDNERMLGPKRLLREKLVRGTKRPEPEWWWVLQARDVWPDRPEPEKWVDEIRFNPSKYNAKKVYEELQRRKDLCREHDKRSEALFNVKHECRIIKMTKNEVKTFIREAY
jgi:hypothetical protein